LFSEDDIDASNYNIELFIEELIEKEEKTVLTNNGMDKLSLMILQNLLRAIRFRRHRGVVGGGQRMRDRAATQPS
jgi:hypothetical protein